VLRPKPLPRLLQERQPVKQNPRHRPVMENLPAKARENPVHPAGEAAQQPAALAEAERVAPPVNSLGITNSSMTASSANGSSLPPSSSRTNPSSAR
jgi:hypothetical protein